MNWKRLIVGMTFLILIITVFVGTMEFLLMGVSLETAFYETFIITICCSISVCILISLSYDRIILFPKLVFGLLFFVLTGVGVSIGVFTGMLILTGRFVINPNSFVFSFVLGLIASIIMTGNMVLRSRLEDKVNRLKAKELENEHLKRVESEARLSSLQAKLNPHFLFNTLNSLAELVYDDPKKAEASIIQLSELYRQVLSISSQRLITLAEELKLLRGYLELEKLRFEDHLQYEIDVESKLNDRKIPGLIIEPLVGNVIKHVLDKKEESVVVQISVKDEGGGLLLSVKDNGPGFDPTRVSMGYGLASIQERLRLLYGEDYGFKIDSESGNGTQVTIRIPNAMKPVAQASTEEAHGRMRGCR